jgi:SAM-dependent methyltransferase
MMSSGGRICFVSPPLPEQGIMKVCRPYSPESQEYATAFELFRLQTDQKEMARTAILKVLGAKPLNTLVDVGAGDGALTSMISRNFDKKILIEPNERFAAEAARRLPQARIIKTRIEDAQFDFLADVVLMSHVLYYVEPEKWRETLMKCYDILKPGGIIIILLQSPKSDYMKIFDIFGIRHHDLDRILSDEIHTQIGMKVELFDSIKSVVECRDETDVIEIGEFMLNCRPGWRPFPAARLLDVTKGVVGQTELPMQISCDQDILVLSGK